MDTQQCIKLRSSIRKYIDKPIPKETIYDILNAARYAPSPKNRQPWRFVVLQKGEKNRFTTKCREILSKRSSDINYLMHKELPSESITFDIIESAPVLILVFNAFPSEQSLGHCNLSFDYFNMQAIGAAIENMLLRATELGIGSLWVGDIILDEELISNSYPQTGKLVAGVVLGISGNIEDVHATRLPISELVIYNGG